MQFGDGHHTPCRFFRIQKFLPVVVKMTKAHLRMNLYIIHQGNPLCVTESDAPFTVDEN
jgi:hypothetical protein